MSILLFRIDERLIHGQVVVGWGASLRPDLIIVVDDEIAETHWEQDLYTLGLPPEINAEFQTVEGARARLADWRQSPDRIIILTRDLVTMRRLAGGGLLRGEEINLGGIHYEAGRRAVLPYLFLNESEEEELRALANEGVTISARDLPNSRRVPLSGLLRELDDRDSLGSGPR